MDIKLQEKLFKQFPLLYGDRTKPMTQTAMCWGIETGDGWYNLIYDLSKGLEKIIKIIIKENPDLSCSYCGRLKSEHDHLGNFAEYLYIPFKFKNTFGSIVPDWKNDNIKRYFKLTKIYFENTLKRKLNTFFNYLFDNFRIGYFKIYRCPGYLASYPRAAQVKEKFGTLRFYMTFETEVISKLIRKAEKKSAITCEKCGKKGKLRDNGWLITLCNSCNTKRNKNKGESK